MTRSILFSALILMIGAVSLPQTSALTSGTPYFQMQTSLQQQADTAITQAIAKRQALYAKDKKNEPRLNPTQQKQVHQYNLHQNNVTTRGTSMVRTGPLEDVPYYDERRQFSNPYLSAPNNQQRNFRVRAIDYYVDGGIAGSEVLRENVIKGSDLKAPRDTYTSRNGGQRSYADIIREIREMQKAARAEVGTSTTLNIFSGAVNPNPYANPYTKVIQ